MKKMAKSGPEKGRRCGATEGLLGRMLACTQWTCVASEKTTKDLSGAGSRDCGSRGVYWGSSLDSARTAVVRPSSRANRASSFPNMPFSSLKIKIKQALSKNAVASLK